MITVRISFEKKNEASYISLLDLQRVMQRVLKRSGLPVWHTLGFNPHIYMTFACPLSLGQESECECVDVKTEAENPGAGAKPYLSVTLQKEEKPLELLQSILKAMAEILAQKS